MIGDQQVRDANDQVDANTNPSWKIDNNVHLVERLVKMRGGPNNREYLVRWKKSQGSSSKDSWIRKEDISQSAIDAYHKTHTLAGQVRKEYRRGKRLKSTW